jgi:hypothetical protein
VPIVSIVIVSIAIVPAVSITSIGEDDAVLYLPDGLIGEVECPLTVTAVIRASFSQIFTRFLEMSKRRLQARR